MWECLQQQEDGEVGVGFGAASAPLGISVILAKMLGDFF